MAKILFLSNHFITLYSFRKELVKRVLEKGHEVYISMPPSDDNSYFQDLGCRILPTKIDRRGMNPLKDLALVFSYYRLIKKLTPDVVLSFTVKPNIYGGIASRLLGVRQICNITGTGAIFLRNSIISYICKLLYRHSVKYCYKVFFQNEGDMHFFVENNLVRENYAIIPGSGVNLQEHSYVVLPAIESLNFIYIGRLMKLKGIEEYLECAKRIHTKYPQTHFFIAGWNEESNCMKKVEAAQQDGDVTYIGFRKDIKEWIRRCHCIIHPAHGGEGISNVMLECAAMGRACVASNICGCCEIVDDGVSGYLFTPGDVEDLSEKVERFILLSSEEKTAMGVRGREKVEKEFDRNFVVEKYMEEIES